MRLIKNHYSKLLILICIVTLVIISSINCSSNSNQVLQFFYLSLNEKIEKQMDKYSESQIQIATNSKAEYYDQMTPSEKSMFEANKKWLEELAPILHAQKSFEDWSIRETSKDVFLVTGYGLGLAESNKPCVGQWYYHNFDRSIRPADAPAMMLEQFLSYYK